MPKRNRFRDWLYQGPLAAKAKACGVSTTMVRNWRTGRAFPHPLRHARLIRLARRDGVPLTPADMGARPNAE